jgi:hypothetical protein
MRPQGRACAPGLPDTDICINSSPYVAGGQECDFKRDPGDSDAFACFLPSWTMCVRGRLHVSESAYESSYDSVHDLYNKQNSELIIFRLAIAMVCLHISAKKKYLLDTLGGKSFTESYGDSYGKSHV